MGKTFDMQIAVQFINGKDYLSLNIILFLHKTLIVFVWIIFAFMSCQPLSLSSFT